MRDRHLAGAFGAVVVGIMLNQAVMQAPTDSHQVVVECPKQCQGLDSSDPWWWIYGCWSLPPQCSADPAPTMTLAPRRPMLAVRGR